MAPITLEQAKLNTMEDYDPAIIDEFRKSSALLDLMVFDRAVSPAGGGATLDYGYRRVKTERGAAFRKLNSEYKTEAATTEKHSVTLAPLGGAFEIDRVIAKLGPAASGEIVFQMQQLIKSTTTKFLDSVINGDTGTEADGFDGLNKALLSTSTEVKSAAEWTRFTSADAGMAVLDDLDEFLAVLDGPPTALFANGRVLAKIRAAARRANMHTKAPVESLIVNGRPLERETIGNVVLINPGAKAGSNDPIIPISEEGKSDIYAVRLGLDGFHGVTTTEGSMIQTWLPDFTTAGAVKKGEVELGPVGVALKSTKAAAVLRGVKVSAGSSEL
ncbi:phage capsid protein [Corynebacterium ulcerans]|uniref:major capsid protein n=1 Tax=Corynebacterium ulcerans TaxID=65058 RepID=UPI002550E7A4|nr:phage capsid protein [Corynebacterium ulcerans]MDK8889722.1 phage capsid protein [Corynebacterium ulcerans]